MRYGVFAAKYEMHRLLYDRWLDRLEQRATGESCEIPVDDVVGQAGHAEDRLYQAGPRLVLYWSLQALGVDPARYTFVDYGSGRGRMLLAAARLPFRKAIGVEYSRSLHEAACANIATYPKARLACHDIVAINDNALDFELPEGDCVAFFFNPFQGQVLHQVAERIEAACRHSPRRVLIVFLNTHRVLHFTQRPAFHRVTPSIAHRAKLAALSPISVELFDVQC